MSSKVMIVDDSAMMRLVIKGIVERFPGLKSLPTLQTEDWRWWSYRNILIWH